MSRLEDKVAVISGGAGSIGLASARAFVAEGARVVLADRDGEAVEAAAAALDAERAVGVACDVTDEDQVRAAVELAVARFGKLDVAFANAGIFGEVAPITEFRREVLEQVLEVNVIGSFLLLKHALAAMERGGSAIVNSSVVGLTSDPGITAYATSKHALVGLMRTAAKEMAPRGIRVNSLHPGPVGNEFQEVVEEQVIGAPRAQAKEAFDGFIPLGRHATAEEIAAVATFLAGDESAFMTGATIAVDGGMSI
jgi:NAD(P)-dependent dehydrogenase (short-subunit alcohol dehydrogenase family)